MSTGRTAPACSRSSASIRCRCSAGPLTLDADFNGAAGLRRHAEGGRERRGHPLRLRRGDEHPRRAAGCRRQVRGGEHRHGPGAAAGGNCRARHRRGPCRGGGGPARDRQPARLSFEIDKASFDGRVVGGLAAGGARRRHRGRRGARARHGIAAAARRLRRRPGADLRASADGAMRRFPPRCLPALRSICSLKAAELDLGLPIPATNAALDLEASAGALNIDLAQAELGGGTLKGAIAATLSDGEAQTTIRGTLERARLRNARLVRAQPARRLRPRRRLLRRLRPRPQRRRNRLHALRHRVVRAERRAPQHAQSAGLGRRDRGHRPGQGAQRDGCRARLLRASSARQRSPSGRRRARSRWPTA